MNMESIKPIQYSDDLIDRVFSIDQAAERLALSPWTIRKWITNGKIKSCKLGSRRVVPATEINRIIAESIQ